MNAPVALLVLSLGLIVLAAHGAEHATRPGPETLRFAPADYSPYRPARVERDRHGGVDWSALARPAPRPRIAVPAVIRAPGREAREDR